MVARSNPCLIFREMTREENIEHARFTQAILECQLKETIRVIETLQELAENCGQLDEKKKLRETLERRIATCIQMQSDAKDP